MWRSMLKVMAATAASAVVHTGAWRVAVGERAATKTFGERNRNGLYMVV